MKNFTRILFYAIVTVFGAILSHSAYSQAQHWLLKNNQDNLVSFNPFSISHDGVAYSNGSSVMNKPDESIWFYVVDDRILDKTGALLSMVVAPSSALTLTGREISIVPVPGSCSKFYIIWLGIVSTTTQGNVYAPMYEILDMSIWNSDAGAYGLPVHYDYNNGYSTAILLTPNGTSWSTHGKGAGLAVTKENSGIRRLFFADNGSIYSFDISSSGISSGIFEGNHGGWNGGVNPSEFEIFEHGTLHALYSCF